MGFKGSLEVHKLNFPDDKEQSSKIQTVDLELCKQLPINGWVEALITVNNVIWCSHGGNITILDIKVCITTPYHYTQKLIICNRGFR